MSAIRATLTLAVIGLHVKKIHWHRQTFNVAGYNMLYLNNAYCLLYVVWHNNVFLCSRQATLALGVGEGTLCSQVVRPSVRCSVTKLVKTIF